MKSSKSATSAITHSHSCIPLAHDGPTYDVVDFSDSSGDGNLGKGDDILPAHRCFVCQFGLGMDYEEEEDNEAKDNEHSNDNVTVGIADIET